MNWVVLGLDCTMNTWMYLNEVIVMIYQYRCRNWMDIVMKKSGYKGPVLLLKTICLRGRNKHGLRITETQKQWGTNRSAGPLTMTEQRNRSPAKSKKNRPWFWGNLNIVIGLKWELVLGKWLNWFMNPPIKGSRNDSFRRFFSAAQWNETQIFTERPVRHVWNSQGTGGILGRLGVKIGPKTGLIDAKSI
jgi:hypothetical protein